MTDFDGKVVFITGAGSGIGRATARAFAAEGCAVALSDVSMTNLRDVIAELGGDSQDVRTYELDVRDPSAIAEVAARVDADFGRIDILINNAGVTYSSLALETSPEDLEWLFRVNFFGTVYCTLAFLPLLRKAVAGHIVNISSVFGLIGMPSQSGYAASKFAVRGFTESLRMELELTGSPIRCSTIHPGGVQTSIVENGRMRDIPALGMTAAGAKATFARRAMTEPETAAAAIVAAVRGKRRRKLVGPDAWIIDAVQRLLPTSYQRLLMWGLRQVSGGKR